MEDSVARPQPHLGEHGLGRRYGHALRLLVANGGVEVHVHVRLDDARRVLGLDLAHLKVVLLAVVVEREVVAQGHTAKRPELGLQHGPGVGDVQEVHALRLELDEGRLGEAHVADADALALGEHQVRHHPVRQVARALGRRELQDAAVRRRNKRWRERGGRGARSEAAE